MDIKFKVGDRIVATGDHGPAAVKGSTGTVVQIRSQSSLPIGVDFDKPVLDKRGYGIGHYCNGFSKDKHGRHMSLEYVKSIEPIKKRSIKKQPRGVLGYHIKRMIK